MNYFNKMLNLTAEPATSLTLHYKVMIGGSFNLIHKTLIEGSSDWEQVPAVLFTTHDGVEITDGLQPTIYVNNKFELAGERVYDPSIYNICIESGGKYFSTREAAEAYIAEHKPLYSLADIRKAWDGFRCGVNDFFELLKQVK